MSLPLTTERITAYLPVDHVQKLKLLAENNGVALAHEFREAVKTYLEVKGA